VLVVDDEPAVRFTLREVLEAHEVTLAASGEEALSILSERDEPFDAILTDLAMPRMTGLEFIAHLAVDHPEIPVLMLTAHGSERAAVTAMRAGAWDYLAKPFDVDELCATVGRAVERSELRRAARKAEAERALGRPIVGRTKGLRRLLTLVERLAPRDVNVLVTGETGTGKELVATLLHAQSRRAAKPLVRFNCGAIVESLAESELFGHEKGAFTGASSARAGYFAQADGGTLVLDEIGELPLGLQAKLLRAVQQGEIQRVGASTPRKVDVRIVACTHRDLRAEVARGTFREDLYYRLAVVEVSVPPLRERREDIPLLAAAFLERYAARFGMEEVALSPELLDALTNRAWPGNVRELENTVARLLALSGGGEIGVSALDPSPRPTREAPGSEALIRGGTFREAMAAHERAVLGAALKEAGGNQSEAARRLGMSRVTLIDRLKRLQIR
jgi:DNA-binding NtrC family response regulator